MNLNLIPVFADVAAMQCQVTQDASNTLAFAVSTVEGEEGIRNRAVLEVYSDNSWAVFDSSFVRRFHMDCRDYCGPAYSYFDNIVAIPPIFYLNHVPLDFDILDLILRSSFYHFFSISSIGENSVHSFDWVRSAACSNRFVEFWVFLGEQWGYYPKQVKVSWHLQEHNVL